MLKGSDVLLLLLIAGMAQSHAKDLISEYCVQLSAEVRSSPPEITLNWPQDSIVPIGYRVYRKAPQERSWGLGTDLPGTSTTYVDHEVRAGRAYEYQVVKRTPRHTGYGYICAGLEVPMTEDRGKLLLLVDNTCAAGLAAELARLQQDLAGDGWTVVRINVNREDSVVKVKHLIQREYRVAPTKVKCVFLFGHVPVPYSGDIAPDGHEPDHRGAWPCDGYYADMDGVWTDRTVKEIRASDPRNHNVPGDGKFDQSTFPAPLKLMVGRVDLANMPGRSCAGSATFPSELELLRNYLNKDHRFRTGKLELPRRGVVGDYFGTHESEAFAASGWRNLSAILGYDEVTDLPDQGTWISSLSRSPALWAYACGPGTYESISGIGSFEPYHDGTTIELVRRDVKAAFVLLYGSWLGDWDAQDDLLRSVLALPTCGLACAWSGRPHWFLHHMGLGETIGFGARLTQNNRSQGLYRNEINTAAGQVHIGLMGDPTLRLHYVAPPGNLKATTNSDGVALQWTASSDCALGYYLYRAANLDGPFARLTTSPISGTNYLDTAPAGTANYMVRALMLETSASGTYFNLSEGAFLLPTVCQSQSAWVRVRSPGHSR